MLPSREEKLTDSTSFRKLVLQSMARLMKLKADELTVTSQVKNEADRKLLSWIREKSMTGSIQDHLRNNLTANSTFVSAVLAMFNDTGEDDIEAAEDEQGALVINWDTAKPIVINKLDTNHYLYMLSGAIPEDFAKTHFDGSNWVVPTP